MPINQQSPVQPDRLLVRHLASSDLSRIVEIHLTSFPGFFLTFLGPRFLVLLYQSIAEDPAGVVLVVSSGECVHGFVAGVTQQSGFYQRLIKRKKWQFAVAALGALIKRPPIALHLVRALSRPKETQSSSAEACLMSIAVSPDAEGKGIGGLLVKAFCAEMGKRGAPTVCLTTDKENNDRTNRFYQKQGFHLSRSFVTPEGRAMYEYVLDLR